MPELPDLLHIQARLRERLLGRTVSTERARDPVVLRFAVRGNLSLLLGRPLIDLVRHAHFLVFRFEGLDLAVNPMLTGRFHLAAPGDNDEASLVFALGLGDLELRYLDDKKMGKAYLIASGDWKAAPWMQGGGVDILSPQFTRERFVSLLKHRRDQVRDFLKVRLKEVCPRCGSKIRTAGVRGMDAYFCPKCQPATREGLVDWNRTGKS